MKKEYVLNDVTICDPKSSHHGKVRQVHIDKGVIKTISAKKINHKNQVEGKGQFMSPSFVDIGTQFRDPGLEHKETISTGLQAAAAGGYTHVATFPNTKPCVQSKESIAYLKTFNPINTCQVLPIVAITKETKGIDLTEMIDLKSHGAIAFSDGDQPIQNPDIVRKALQYVQPFDGLIIQRPEDLILNAFGTMHEGVTSTMLGLKGMPSLAEEAIISRDLQLLEYAGGRLHFHKISTAGAVDMIKKAKKAGLQVTCDVSVGHLLYKDEILMDFDTNYKVNPPYRSAEDRKALRKGIYDGTIDAIISAHEPHNVEDKELEFDLAEFGTANLQTVLSDLLTINENPLELPIQNLAHNPRLLLDLEDAEIKEGNKANYILFDPKQEWTLDEKSNFSVGKNSPRFGQTETRLKGKVLLTVRESESFENKQ